MLSKKMILALTVLAPFALAAPAFAAGDATTSTAPVAKPLANDSAAPAGKTMKSTAKKPTETKQHGNSTGKRGAIDQVWTTKAAQNDKPVTTTGKSAATDKKTGDKSTAKSGSAGGAGVNSSIGVTGSGLSSSMDSSAKLHGTAKPDVSHGGSAAKPDASNTPAKP